LLFPAFALTIEAGLRLLPPRAGRASLRVALPRAVPAGLPVALMALTWPLRWPRALAAGFALRFPEAPLAGRAPFPFDRAPLEEPVLALAPLRLP
jgi:hypothetical protein